MKGILHTCRTRLEPLENRCLLTGDALVAIVDGELQITGDADDNQIAVSSAFDGETRVGNSFVVTGLNGTTINGSAGTDGGDASATFSAVSKIKLSLGDGDDTIQVTDANVQGKLALDAGTETTRSSWATLAARLPPTPAPRQAAPHWLCLSLSRNCQSTPDHSKCMVNCRSARARGTTSLPWRTSRQPATRRSTPARAMTR